MHMKLKLTIQVGIHTWAAKYTFIFEYEFSQMWSRVNLCASRTPGVLVVVSIKKSASICFHEIIIPFFCSANNNFEYDCCLCV